MQTCLGEEAKKLHSACFYFLRFTLFVFVRIGTRKEVTHDERRSTRDGWRVWKGTWRESMSTVATLQHHTKVCVALAKEVPDGGNALSKAH